MGRIHGKDVEGLVGPSAVTAPPPSRPRLHQPQPGGCFHRVPPPSRDLRSILHTTMPPGAPPHHPFHPPTTLPCNAASPPWRCTHAHPPCPRQLPWAAARGTAGAPEEVWGEALPRCPFRRWRPRLRVSTALAWALRAAVRAARWRNSPPRTTTILLARGQRWSRCRTLRVTAAGNTHRTYPRG